MSECSYSSISINDHQYFPSFQHEHGVRNYWRLQFLILSQNNIIFVDKQYKYINIFQQWSYRVYLYIIYLNIAHCIVSDVMGTFLYVKTDYILTILSRAITNI